MSLNPYPLSVSTNKLKSDTPVSLTTTTPWSKGPDPFSPAYDKTIAVTVASSTKTTLANQVVRQDNPNDFRTSSYVRPLVLASVVSIGIDVVGQSGTDIDLYFVRDNAPIGVLDASDVTLASSAGSTAIESLSYLLPADGTYLIAVHGWSVPGGTTTFSLTTTILSTGAAPVSATNLPAVVGANSYSTFKIAWDLPSSTVDGIAPFAFFVSPGNAPLSLSLLVSFNLRIDRAAPTISDLSPTPGSTIRESRPTIVANVFDTATQQLDIYSPTLSVDGTDVTQLTRAIPQFAGATSCCYNLLTMVYIPLAPLLDGPHSATITTKDLAGNVASLSWSWNVDTSGPTLVISSPEDRTVTAQPTVDVRGRTESGATLTVRGSVVALAADGTFATTVSLTEGTNVIDITATDLAGNSASTSRTVVYDSTGPTLSGVRSTEGTRTRAMSTVIKGSSSEPLASVTVNGAPAQILADGSFSFPASLVEGANVFQVQASDFAGHPASTSLTVTRDTVAPVITPIAPTQTYVTDVDRNTVWINGTVAGGASSVSVNGFPVATRDGPYSKQFTLGLGANVFVIEAKDDLGNVATETVSVTFAPIVVQRSYSTVIAIAVAVVLLVVGLLVGWMVWGRGGEPRIPDTGPAHEPSAPEVAGPEPEEMPAEEEMTTEEEEL
jgi:uncharacterized protein YfaP (DUF2135 family)